MRTIKIFLLLLALSATGCQILPPRDVFVQRFTLRHPRNPHALFIEGKSFLSQNEPGKAAVRFREALELQPEFEEARLGLAHCYREEKYDRRARDLYREVLKISPRNVSALEGLAVTESRLGHPDEALKLFNQALSIQPNSVSILNALADFYYSRRQYPDALREWEKSLTLDPNQPELRSVVEDLRGYVKKYHSSGAK